MTVGTCALSVLGGLALAGVILTGRRRGWWM